MFSQNAIARFIVAAVLLLEIPLVAVRFSQQAAELSTNNLIYATATLAIFFSRRTCDIKATSGVFRAPLQ